MVNLFQGRNRDSSPVMLSELSSVSSTAPGLTIDHTSDVLSRELICKSAWLLARHGWGKGQTWKVLLESSWVVGTCEPPAVISSLMAGGCFVIIYLFLPIIITQLLLIWDNPALARHYQFSAPVHRIPWYSQPQIHFDSLENVFLAAPDTYWILDAEMLILFVCAQTEMNSELFQVNSLKGIVGNLKLSTGYLKENEMWHCSLKAEKWWQCSLTAAVLEWHSTLCINTWDSRGVSVTLCVRKLLISTLELESALKIQLRRIFYRIYF